MPIKLPEFESIEQILKDGIAIGLIDIKTTVQPEYLKKNECV